MSQKPLILRQGHTSSLYDMPLHIVWQPTMFCNYHCSYCSVGDNRPKGRDWLDIDHNKAVFNNLLALNRPWYHLSVSGGEPTVYPWLCDMLEFIIAKFGPRLGRIHMTSNGSNDPEIYMRLGEIIKSGPLTLYISLHTDHVKLTDIEAMTKAIAPNGFLCYALMFNPAKGDYVREIYALLCRLRKHYPFDLTIDTLREVQNGGIVDRRYTTQDFAWQREAQGRFCEIAKKGCARLESGAKSIPGAVQNSSFSLDCGYKTENVYNQNKALQEGIYNLKGCYCALGTNVFNLQPDGYAFSSVCGQSTKSKKPVYEESPYKDPDFAQIAMCAREVCGCRANDFLMRFSNEEEAQNYLMHFKLKQERLIQERKKQKRQDALLNTLLTLLAGKDDSLLKSVVDQEWYYTQYPDVAESGMPAAIHYCLHGWREGRDPAPWFNTRFYLETFPEAAQSGMNPLRHYLLRGLRDGNQGVPNIGLENQEGL